jgi:hypothetical protein
MRHNFADASDTMVHGLNSAYFPLFDGTPANKAAHRTPDNEQDQA